MVCVVKGNILNVKNQPIWGCLNYFYLNNELGKGEMEESGLKFATKMVHCNVIDVGGQFLSIVM